MITECDVCRKKIDTDKRPENNECYYHQIEEEQEDDCYYCSEECIEKHFTNIILTNTPWRRKMINWLNKFRDKGLTIDFTK